MFLQIEYLNFHKKKESGLELLKKAADAGHFGSCYFLGILLICKEEDESETRQNTQQGLQLLARIETNVQMRECSYILTSLTNDHQVILLSYK